MGGKNTASKSTGGVKIVELGNELRVDPRQIVAAAQEMAMENAKVPASWVTAGQADRLRAKFGGQGALKAKIERKLKFFERANETPTDAAKAEPAVKDHAPKLGKRTFERDRRAIFGVVSSAGGVRLEHETPVKVAEPSAKKDAAPTIPGTPPALAESAAAPVESNAVAAKDGGGPSAARDGGAPTKFIQIQVAPPIRREGQSQT